MGADTQGITAINSRDNPKIKQIRALRQRKERDARGLFLVEGIHHIGECAEAGRRSTSSSVAQVVDKGRWLEYICYCPELLTSDFALHLIQEQAQDGVPCYRLPAELLVSLAEKENPQGILAVARQHRCNLDRLNPANFPWGIALDAPQDPGNIGAILRTIDAVGASGMLLLDSSADPFHPSAVRASMGALFWYPVAWATFSEFQRWIRVNGYHLIGTSTHASLDYREASPYSKPLILLMGSEREGLTDEQKAACDQVVHIPMLGRVSSLNLAVAMGIVAYTMLEK
jgi:TrmH family RNA methyltransferase